MAYEIVVIGASWGGLNAVRELLSHLPREFALPIVFVQHRHKESDNILASLLQGWTSLRVWEVEDKSPIAPASLYVAPADYHLLVERGYFSLSTDEAVRYSRPSIDVAFASAADTYGKNTAGVILTGANEDGSRGLQRIADRGGLALVQQPETAESPEMPLAALRTVRKARSMSIHDIAATLGLLAVATVPG